MRAPGWASPLPAAEPSVALCPQAPLQPSTQPHARNYVRAQRHRHPPPVSHGARLTCKACQGGGVPVPSPPCPLALAAGDPPATIPYPPPRGLLSQGIWLCLEPHAHPPRFWASPPQGPVHADRLGALARQLPPPQRSSQRARGFSPDPTALPLLLRDHPNLPLLAVPPTHQAPWVSQLQAGPKRPHRQQPLAGPHGSSSHSVASLAPIPRGPSPSAATTRLPEATQLRTHVLSLLSSHSCLHRIRPSDLSQTRKLRGAPKMPRLVLTSPQPRSHAEQPCPRWCPRSAASRWPAPLPQRCHLGPPVLIPRTCLVIRLPQPHMFAPTTDLLVPGRHPAGAPWFLRQAIPCTCGRDLPPL